MAFQKLILTSMPTEILREIAAALRTHDQTVFCRVSRLFNVVTAPVLYRHIHLDTVERTLACFHTLAQNPKRHTHVRSLRIVIDSDNHGAYIPTDIIFPLENGLRTLNNLESLYLRIPDFSDAYLMIFATLLLPALRMFSTYHTGTYSPILSSFVNRHRDLTHLDLIRPWAPTALPSHLIQPHSPFLHTQAHSRALNSNPNPNLNLNANQNPAPLPILHLPRLRVYRGCSAYATCLSVFTHSLQHAEIWDAPPHTDVDVLLGVLRDATTPGMPFALTFLWDGPQASVFGSAARCIPQVKVLKVGPFMGAQRALSAATIQEIADTLDNFVSLAHLEFDNVEPSSGASSGPSASARQLNLTRPVQPIHTSAADFVALTVWSTHCPTLVTARLHCRNWSRHNATGEWVFVD
ncbi:hypothetical protein C8R45DRAFT_298791 [Mycena sanguinolenta]|nr:hypothetical protein C8R45DRAFT_298791 [Mycena sanguinolenta]